MKMNNFVYALMLFVFATLVGVHFTGCTNRGSDNGNESDANGESEGDPVTGPYAINGYVQKGPFISGSSITIQELDDSLNPTGTSYQTMTTDDFGTFSLGSRIETRYIEIIATGFYFDEVGGELSGANLSLRARSDLETTEEVNFNILTTLEQDRIEHLIAYEGKSFPEARAQAEIELLSIFHISGDNLATFDQMDISQEGDSNAVLLAVSLIVQSDNTVAELSELISKINLVIKEDGALDNATYVDELKNNAMELDLVVVRDNLAERYEALGLTVTIPDFKEYIDSDGDGEINKTDFDITGITPLDGGEASPTPLLDWDDLVCAEKYEVQIASSETGLEAAAIIETTESQYQIIDELSIGDVRCWRVHALNKNGIAEPWSDAWSFTIRPYEIGDVRPAGGIVFYTKESYSNGWQCLEVAPVDTEWTNKEWGADGVNIDGAEGTAIGTGEQNTADIIACLGTGSTYAAQLCNGLTYGGYNDWFLPSKDELDQIYKNLHEADLGGFALDNYWSSSELIIDDNVWIQYFVTGYQRDYGKGNSARIRAVRAF